MQPPERFEDGPEVLRIDAGPVIPHREDPLVPVADAGNVDIGAAVSAIFDCVSDQILKDLAQLAAVETDFGQGFAVDGRMALIYRLPKVRQSAVERLAGIHPLAHAVPRTGGGIGQEIGNQMAHAAGPVYRKVQKIMLFRRAGLRQLALQQLKRRDDGAKRFLQIMGGRKREPVQIFVEPSSLECGMKPRPQQNRVYRFEQIVFRPHLDTMRGAFQLIEGGHHDHRDGTQRFVAFHFPEHVEAAETGHHHVQ